MRRRVLGGLGVLATFGAVAVLVRPDLAAALPPVVDVLESQDAERLLLALGSVVGIYAAWAARAGRSGRPPTNGPAIRFEATGDLPEQVSAVDRARTGEAFDADARAACDGDDRALRAVRTALADTAAAALVRADRPLDSTDNSDDDSAEAARRAVGAGTWTDDDLAAAFLADESGPAFPLSARLRAWLDPEAERRRRVERTVDAVSRLLDEADGESAPAESDGGGDG